MVKNWYTEKTPTKFNRLGLPLNSNSEGSKHESNMGNHISIKINPHSGKMEKKAYTPLLNALWDVEKIYKTQTTSLNETKETIYERNWKLLLKWGERIKRPRTSWRASYMDFSSHQKICLSYPPPTLTATVERAFTNQTNISWIQALMGLLVQYWNDIQNQHLQMLGEKSMGKLWIYALTRKLWDTAWYIYNYINHTLHSMENPTNTLILKFISANITYY